MTSDPTTQRKTAAPTVAAGRVPWRVKSFLQRAVAVLPEKASANAYYALQRRFGSLQKIDPRDDLVKCRWFIEKLHGAGSGTEGKSFLEIGTGWMVNVPLGLWLSGASRIVTVDKNRFLKPELVIESARYMVSHPQEVSALLGAKHGADKVTERLSLLKEQGNDIRKILHCCGIEYHAPADAAALPLNDRSIDCFYSTNVLEHVPLPGLTAILLEGKRVIKQNGLMMHRIDLSDHFSHDDRSITSINFLRFNNKQWKKFSSGQNRLRNYEYFELFTQLGIRMLSNEETIDPVALRALQNGFPLDKKYQGASHEDLAVRLMELVCRFDGETRQ
jgi:hypothetical protein